MKGSTVLASSFVATPRTVKFLALYCDCMLINIGISPRQGSHQVPQKFTNRVLPLKLARVTSLPCRSLNVTVGSSWRSLAGPAADPEPVDVDTPLQPEKPSITAEKRTPAN